MSLVAIAVDDVAEGRIAAIRTAVQLVIGGANDDYVRSGAVMMGLTRLESPGAHYAAADFATAPGGDAVVDVEVDAPTAARAAALAASWTVEIALIYSAALCTGLASLAGVATITDRNAASPGMPGRLFGPFS